MHPFGEEQAALLGFAVVAEYAVALVLQAGHDLAREVLALAFAVSEKTAVLGALVSPAHAGATIEDTHAAARNHDVELSLRHVGTDVCRHDDKLLAVESLGVGVGFVLALAIKGELVALSAGTAVRCRHGCKGEGHIATTVNRKRNLANASHCRTATIANAAVAPVGIVGSTLVRALSGVVSASVLVPGAVRLTAVPITGCPAGTASAAALGLDSRAAAVSALRRTAALGGRRTRRFYAYQGFGARCSPP